MNTQAATAANPDDAHWMGLALAQAQLAAHGQLRVPTPAHAESLFVPFVIDHHGWRFGKYPPGWPVVLGLGFRLGIQDLVNPLLAGQVYNFPIVATGNTGLKQETMTAVEVGYTGVVRNRATLTAAVYWNTTDNAIFFSQATRYTAAAPPPSAKSAPSPPATAGSPPTARHASAPPSRRGPTRGSITASWASGCSSPRR